MSSESLKSERQEPSFEEKNAALSNEWGKIIAYADLARKIEFEQEEGTERLTDRLLNEEQAQLLYADLPEDTNNQTYGVDENYSFESQAKGLEGVLERLARAGVTPENHEVAAALRRILDATKNLGTWSLDPNVHPLRQEILNRDDLIYAVESLHDAIDKHQPSVTGAY